MLNFKKKKKGKPRQLVKTSSKKRKSSGVAELRVLSSEDLTLQANSGHSAKQRWLLRGKNCLFGVQLRTGKGKVAHGMCPVV